MSHWPQSHYNSADEYLVAGTPFVTSSNGAELTNTTPIQITFPYVTQWVKIFNNSAAATSLRVGFSSNGVKGTETKNYFVVSGTQNSDSLAIKCKSLFLLSNNGTNVSFSIMAGLTMAKDMFPLTGSIPGTTDGIPGVG